jgi:hypothetical protein
MPEKKLKDLKSFTSSYKVVQQMSKEDFLSILTRPMEEALRHEVFKDLKNLDEKKEWRFILNLGLQVNAKLIDWNNWKNISVSSTELSLINPSLRSYCQYYKTLKKIFLND